MDERTIIVKKSSVGSFLQGIAIGAAVALLFAPRSGRETRGMLTERGTDIKDRATELARDTADRAQGYISDARDRIQTSVKDVRNKAQDTVSGVKSGVQSGRMGSSATEKQLRAENEELKRDLTIEEDINNPNFNL